MSKEKIEQTQPGADVLQETKTPLQEAQEALLAAQMAYQQAILAGRGRNLAEDKLKAWEADCKQKLSDKRYAAAVVEARRAGRVDPDRASLIECKV